MSNKRKPFPTPNTTKGSRADHAANPAASQVPETTGIYPVIEISGLSHRQQSALPIVALSHTVAQASRDSGVSEKTLRKWLDDPEFRAELDRLREESYDLARKQFQALVPKFISVLAAEAIENPDPAIRIRAARYALNYAVRFRDFDKLADDLHDLRAALLDGK